MDHLCYFCLVFVMHSRLFIAVLWSPEGKRYPGTGVELARLHRFLILAVFIILDFVLCLCRDLSSFQQILHHK